MGSAWGVLGSILRLGLPFGLRGPHSTLRLRLWGAELECLVLHNGPWGGGGLLCPHPAQLLQPLLLILPVVVDDPPDTVDHALLVLGEEAREGFLLG